MTNSRRSILLLFVVVFLFTAIGIWFAQRERAAEEEVLAPTPVSEPVEGARLLTQPADSSGERAHAPVTTPDEEVPEQLALAALSKVRGRVVDPVGAPVADAAISLETSDPSDAQVLGRSNADGRFEFEAQKRDVVLMASTPSLRTLRTQFWRVLAPEEGLIVVAPCVDVNGVVIDEDGRPLAQVKIRVELPEALLAGIPHVLDKTLAAKDWSRFTDAAGRFELRRAFRVPGARIEASLAHYVTSRVEVPRDTQDPVRLVLARDPASPEKFVSGVVLRANGDPAVDATVRLGDLAASCGSRGEFRLSLPETLFEALPLVAAEKGSQAAVVPNFRGVLDAASSRDAPIELRLGPPALSIRGVVFDEQDRPLANCTVGLLDPVSLSSSSKMQTAEDLAAGAPSPTITSASGEFELGGLFERDYRLQVVDTTRLGRLETDPIRAGANGIVIRFPADSLVSEVRGRVVGRDGTPIASANLGVMVVTELLKSSSSNRTSKSSKGFGQRVKSLEDGSFRLASIPRRQAELWVDGPGVVARKIRIEELDLSQPLEITLDRYGSLRLEGLPVGDDTHWIAALDAQGKELQVRVVTGNSSSASNRVQTKGDSLQQYEVSEAAVELVHYFPYDTVVARRTVRLVPGEVTVVKW